MTGCHPVIERLEDLQPIFHPWDGSPSWLPWHAEPGDEQVSILGECLQGDRRSNGRLAVGQIIACARNPAETVDADGVTDHFDIFDPAEGTPLRQRDAGRPGRPDGAVSQTICEKLEPSVGLPIGRPC